MLVLVRYAKLSIKKFGIGKIILCESDRNIKVVHQMIKAFCIYALMDRFAIKRYIHL